MTISNSLFTHNQAYAPDYDRSWGGAICRENGSGEMYIINTTIEGNCSYGENGGHGGGMWTKGGGLYLDGTGNLTMIQCQVTDNSLISGGNIGFGGGIYIGGSLAAGIYYSTIVNNSTTGGGALGGGIWIQDTTVAVTLGESILINNRANSGNDYVNNGNLTLERTLYDPNGILGPINTDGGYNTVYHSGDVVFASGSYRLAANSVAIDKTHVNHSPFVQYIGETDLAGNTRFVGTYVDYGAYEYQGTSSIDAVFAEYDDGDIDIDLDIF